ncbi:MAG TPA: Hsp20/alpha crystallin family protein [Patescibacteria group bacterium]|nr:Hsp20/alpha crystallin family protein [Patescibacteria group bacterium]
MSARSSRGARGEEASAAWDPLRELTGLKERLNRLFETALRRGGTPGASELAGWVPAVDLREERDAFVIAAEIPGVARGDLNLRVEGRTVTIAGDRPQAREARGADHLRVERSYGAFSRTFHLPAGVDETAVRATLRQGILEVRLPKATRERTAPVRIRVG